MDYSRFTDRLRKVMQFANQEAQRFNHTHVDTHHVLLGLVKEGCGVAANVLKNLNIDLRKIRVEVEKVVKSGPDMITMGKLPLTQGTEAVLVLSAEEAERLDHRYVGTEHLLLGLLRVDDVATKVLVDLGVDLEEVRSEILSLITTPPALWDRYFEMAFKCLMDAAGLSHKSDELVKYAGEMADKMVAERQKRVK